MIHLKDMSQSEYKKYFANAIKAYAKEKIKAGVWEENSAIKNAEKEYKKLLPNGLNTPDAYLYSIYNSDFQVGYIWFSNVKDNQELVFIYDFGIFAEFQDQGIGTKALELAENEARKLGFNKIGLHAFGSNSRAIHVYKKSGFEITDVSMQKIL
ncbi:GNAT family N-acetyltransferase [Oenococcus sp. UCMA 17063]|nr:GNAT family N-acetyltransferase [Oenococcus sp. UCMA 17063]